MIFYSHLAALDIICLKVEVGWFLAFWIHFYRFWRIELSIYKIPAVSLSSEIDNFSSLKRFFYKSRSLYNARRRIKIPFKSNGYNYEAKEVMKCLRNGEIESKSNKKKPDFKFIKKI